MTHFLIRLLHRSVTGKLDYVTNFSNSMGVTQGPMGVVPL